MTIIENTEVNAQSTVIEKKNAWFITLSQLRELSF